MLHNILSGAQISLYGMGKCQDTFRYEYPVSCTELNLSPLAIICIFVLFFDNDMIASLLIQMLRGTH